MNATRVTMLILALSGTACAAGGAQAARPVDDYRLADGTQVTCRMEAPTGSHIKERVCRRVAETSEAKRITIDSYMNRPVVNTRTGG